MLKLPPANFHQANRASEILSKIGRGEADADFARGIHMALDRSQQTGKKSKVIVSVEIDPDPDSGSLIMRVNIDVRIPKVPSVISQMHPGPNGELLTQQEFLLGGGPDERPAPTPVKTESSKSGRMPVASPKSPAPLADSPKLKPIAGSDAEKA